MSERSVVQTWRPGNKPGAMLPKEHYDTLRNIILSLLTENEVLRLTTLIEEVQRQFSAPVSDFGWTLLQVKQDLEARGLICVKFFGPERTPTLMLRRRGRSAIHYPW